MNTPVYTGYLRYNWYWTTQLAAGISPVRGGKRDRRRTYPDAPWNQARQSIITNTNTWYIINNVEYAALLQRGVAEYAGDRHQGFFNRAINAFILGVSA